MTRSIVKDVSMIRSACSSSFLPREIVASVAPPVLNRLANAPISVISGKQIPSPVSATVPPSGIWPIYILSTMLYST